LAYSCDGDGGGVSGIETFRPLVTDTKLREGVDAGSASWWWQALESPTGDGDCTVGDDYSRQRGQLAQWGRLAGGGGW
jgi:hypothetical protein